jgi:hypothetical protein
MESEILLAMCPYVMPVGTLNIRVEVPNLDDLTLELLQKLEMLRTMAESEDCGPWIYFKSCL